uniref:Novel immune-type receptor 5 n=1 Tax=Cyprinus carpio TaxID=7962 RepID=A0A8C2EWP4_CYPCA
MDRQVCVMIFLLYEISVKAIYGDLVRLHPVVSVHDGDPVVLSCFIKTKQISMALWYKQVTGEEPRLIASSLLHSSKSQFHEEFNSSHFDAVRGTESFNLTIVNALQSDSGTYYCATSFSNIIEFGNGIHLVIKGAEISKPTSLQLPKTELIKSGVNISLQCSIQNELVSSGGENRLYWFKHGSDESPPGFIYVHGNTSDGCVRSSEADCLSPTCEFNLPKKKFSSSQTGIYCALATCGEALFGNIYKHNPDNFENQNILFYIQIGLAALLSISFTINILLCCLRKSGRKSQQIQTTDEDDNDDVSVIKNREMTYATVQTSAKHSRVKRESRPEDTLYSGLACQQQS